MLPTFADWPDPAPIKHELLPVLAMQPANIPAPYRDWVVDVTGRMQCPIDFIAVAAVVVTASIIGAGCGIKPKRKDDWLVIPNLWGGVVGRPGMLKTPAISEVMRMVNALESEAKQTFDLHQSLYNADIECQKAERDAIKNAMLNAQKQMLKTKVQSNSYEIAALKEKFSQLQEPSKPVWRRYKTNDATIEKLSELLADNPRGLLLYRDELIGLLASWEQEGREGDRAFFLESWNGDGSMTSDRIGRGTVHTKHLCLSIFGSTQPTKLVRYLHRAMRGCDNDGLMQRFQLMVYPDESKQWQLIDREPDYQAKERVAAILKQLSEMDFLQHGAMKNAKDQFPYFQFSDDAQELFYHWLTELEQIKLKSDDHPVLLEHLAKYRSMVPSLALVFHLITVAAGDGAAHITLDSLLMAISWSSYLESHARRIYGMASNVTNQSASRLAKKIEQGVIPQTFSIRDIYFKDWALLDTKELVQQACDELVEAGWLRQELQEAKAGRPKSARYEINPKCVTGNPSKPSILTIEEF